MARFIPADVVDASGNVHKTVGENIRNGENGTGEVYECVVHAHYDDSWSCQISGNTSAINDLVCNVSNNAIYLTSPTVDNINIKSFGILEVTEITGVPLSLGKGIDTSGVEVISTDTTGIVGADFSIKVYFKVGEW